MIVITEQLVLDPVEVSDSDQPWIGYHNLVTASNIVADTTAAGYPATNLATPMTNRRWQAANNTTQYVTISLDGLTQIDYLAIAKHNFGSSGIQSSVEAYDGSAWSAVAGPVLPADNAPLLFRFAKRTPTAIRLKMIGGGIAARIAVLYVGKLLIMQRRIYAGHAPLPHARKSEFVGGLSESGQFLGQIQLRSWRASVATFRQLTPAWSRSYLIPFLASARALPMFFAWRPTSYPFEIGFARLTNDPIPTPAQADGNLTSVDLEFEGVA